MKHPALQPRPGHESREAAGFVVRRAQARRRAASSGPVRLGRWLFRHRTAAFLPLAVIVLAGAAAAPLHPRSPGCGAACRAGAIALLGAAAAVRLHVAGRARPGTSSRGATFEAGELITTGMYARTRNPLYLANLLIWAGMSLLAGPWWVALGVTGLAAFQYHWIVLAEEHYLAGRYGDAYRAYCRRVPRWLGRTSAHASPPTSTPPFTWRRAVFREADTLLLITLGAWCADSLARAWVPWDPDARAPAAWLLVPAVATAAWLAAKRLKKSRWKSRAGVKGT